ncbi:cytochrome d ubiquinol oxidase subunit II [Hamadaea sp. NPDC051192]|uniref:cytochrome d ubiquinol oxidase subunit II n=1 Tax=Hamadaea sp. NPDC051192 TaxID=3154940 RepID=UPI0034147753
MTFLLALLFGGYFVLGGLDYGVALVSRGRADLDRVAPVFLGNEVWLVGAVGLLFGAYPLNEGELLSQQRVPVGVALLGVILVTAAYGLRLFRRTPGGVGLLDGVARIGGALALIGWGAALGGIWQGGTFHVTAVTGACALGLLALGGLHGWAFVSRRWAILGGTSVVILALTFAAGSAVDWHVADSATLDLVRPAAYALLPLVLLAQAATWWMFRTRHPRQAPVAS